MGSSRLTPGFKGQRTVLFNFHVWGFSCGLPVTDFRSEFTMDTELALRFLLALDVNYSLFSNFLVKAQATDFRAFFF